MKYKLSNVKHEGIWKFELDYWEGCYCSHKTVKMQMGNKPTLRDAIKVFNSL